MRREAGKLSVTQRNGATSHGFGQLSLDQLHTSKRESASGSCNGAGPPDSSAPALELAAARTASRWVGQVRAALGSLATSPGPQQPAVGGAAEGVPPHTHQEGGEPPTLHAMIIPDKGSQGAHTAADSPVRRARRASRCDDCWRPARSASGAAIEISDF